MYIERKGKETYVYYEGGKKINTKDIDRIEGSPIEQMKHFEKEVKRLSLDVLDILKITP